MKNSVQKNLMYTLMAFAFIVLISFAGMPLSANAAPKAHTAHKGSDKTGSKHEGWTAISTAEELVDLGVNGGRGYLTKDIEIRYNNFEVSSNKEVYLCLNGHSIVQSEFSENIALNTVLLDEDSILNLYDENGNSGKICHDKDCDSAGVCIKSGKFIMNGGTISDNSYQCGAGVRNEQGTFIMNGGKISRNYASTSSGGGGVYVYDGEFIMNGGYISDNSSYGDAGAVALYSANFTMNGGTISNNSCRIHGGAIYMWESTASINDGSIAVNHAGGSGGGVYVAGGTLTMTGGSVSNNTCDCFGGGFCSYGSNLQINGGNISGNESLVSGGGIYLEVSSAEISGGNITDNKTQFSGGGIDSENNDLHISGCNISKNSAYSGGGLVIHVDAMDQKFSIDGTVIKDNITQEKGTEGIYICQSGVVSGVSVKDKIFVEDPYKAVSFYPNNGKGNAYTQYYNSAQEEVLTENRFTRSGFKFYNWNTKADGSGKKIKAGSVITGKNTKLYAQWKPSKYSVSFDANGGSGTMTAQSIKYNTSTALNKNAFSRQGYKFNGWNTQADGKGTSYADGEKVKFSTLNTNKITLYAQWKANTNIPYTVEHYKQKLDGTYAAKASDTETLKGKTNSKVTPAVKTYTGFTSPVTKTAKIKADGSLVVKYYYTRNSYKLTWDFAGGSAKGSYTKGNVKYGAKITAPVPTRDGYEFTGWDKTVATKMPANDVTYKAKWRKLSQKEQVTAFVERFYTIILERPAEAAGLADWTNRLISKTATGADVAAGFINSEEFQKKKMTDEEYVTKLYRAFFDREPDKAGFDNWIKELKNGKSRDYVLRGFINSVEFNNLCKKYGINAGSY
ncbi:MAG: DUF4214 domain-containing protein [Lachnospiraceae bacterium]|nr:DUF4214 domain-containing protein [Lachnospiraceae bacterium]